MRLTGVILFLLVAVTAFLHYMGEATAYRISALDVGEIEAEMLPSLERGQPLSLYTAIADTALALRPADLERAEAASVQLLLKNKNDITTWNRLAFIDFAEDGQLGRDGIAALQQSYNRSPYGDLALMTWRVDFATAVWTSLPDELQQKTLGQIPVIGRFGVSWEWRVRNCKENPHQDLYEAICAIAPGVNRPGQSG